MTKITGHRGARNLWPENSLTGFRNVLSLPVDAIEFDVHLTDEGELLVIHDATLDRTTEATGPVRRLTPEQRAETHLKGSTDTVPTLAEVLEILAPAEDKQLHIEIKANDAGKAYKGIVDQIVTLIDEYDLAERCYLTSFDIELLETCREYAPDISRLISVNAEWAERQGGLKAFLAKVEDLVEVIAIHHELMDKEWDFLSEALPLDRLCVWTVNDAEGIEKWLKRGIGHITSDSPDIALAARKTLI